MEPHARHTFEHKGYIFEANFPDHPYRIRFKKVTEKEFKPTDFEDLLSFGAIVALEQYKTGLEIRCGSRHILLIGDTFHAENPQYMIQELCKRCRVFLCNHPWYCSNHCESKCTEESQ